MKFLVGSFSSITVPAFVCFFFKQTTAYEMCGRDWSSDVCSSDLCEEHLVPHAVSGERPLERGTGAVERNVELVELFLDRKSVV